ncbi:helix-turn-helix domain-containing protein [Streptomyces tubbatahanensis]|uniref:Helix-turn-helix domain-containing protein n=1 Tax=Streptomyces tubbatahanensis TaxID=2923272 RepID=A0ABY3XZG2_9ACTN|nr:helix-turn-helix transcriptional regulator [Streptomyces tubbatahanensis]UNS99944.1 helix-turn-helix domain-containing protein [Streptomyces tubbatahanensis]
MTDEEPGPDGCGKEPERSDSLRTFGAVVKAFRERAGLTQEAWAELSGYSLSTCAGVEQGRRFPPPGFIERAEDVFDAFGALRKASKFLSRGHGLAAWFRQWAKMELTALSLYTYECRVVPGLLQTEAYARAVIDGVPPSLRVERVEELVAARSERQELLHRDDPITFSFIVEQAILERRTGGPDVTRQLLDHIIACARLRNVELQIMPLVQPDHAGLDGPMQLMETQERQWFGYIEGQKVGQLISDPEAVSDLQARYAKLRSQALTPADSLSLLKRMRGAL